MSMSIGQSVGSRAMYRQPASRCQQLSLQHANGPQTLRVCASVSRWRQRTQLLCKSSLEDQSSADDQDRQKSGLSASSSGEEGEK